MPVKLLQPVADLGAELLQPTDNELQVGLQPSLGPRLFGLYFERVQSLLEASNAGLGFGQVGLGTRSWVRLTRVRSAELGTWFGTRRTPAPDTCSASRAGHARIRT